MHWSGIVVGAAAFLIIGMFHPIVVKCEYYFSEKIWPVFLAGGLAFCAASLFVSHGMLSAILAVFGFSMLWSIGELSAPPLRRPGRARGRQAKSDGNVL